jgi:hypothetical protein
MLYILSLPHEKECSKFTLKIPHIYESSDKSTQVRYLWLGAKGTNVTYG